MLKIVLSLGRAVSAEGGTASERRRACAHVVGLHRREGRGHVATLPPFFKSPVAASAAFAARRLRPLPLLGMTQVGSRGLWGEGCAC